MFNEEVKGMSRRIRGCTIVKSIYQSDVRPEKAHIRDFKFELPGLLRRDV
jgi:hypothetical protein